MKKGTRNKKKPFPPRGLTLCWFCRHAVPSDEKGTGCPWSRDMQPVEGWNAVSKPILIRVGTKRLKRYAESYLVRSCPLYEKD